jgi:pimeloyl-ACP methyl ester carboxylesterase
VTHFSYRGDDGVALFARGLSGESVRADDRVVVLLHGGGPDHESLVPLGEALSDLGSVILPDVRGYGRSVCPDPSAHTWSRYAADVIRLLDTLGIERAVVGGAGLGGTVAARTALACPGRVEALILISVEDVEDDVAKAAEVAFMDAFASRVREAGLAAAWAPILPELAPIIRAMVEDAIPRSDPRSVAAAAAIGTDRSFRTLEDLGAIQCPTLIVAGMDWRHPPELAARMAALMPDGRLAPTSLSRDIRTMSAFADALAPAIRDFLSTLPKRPSDALAVAPDPVKAGSGSPASG